MNNPSSTKCDDIPKDNHGTWTQSPDNKPGSTAKLTCDKGYKLQGDSDTMKCNAKGMWDFKEGIPQCISEDADDGMDLMLGFDSRCRNATNLVSFYMTELNGLNVIVKLLIIVLYLKKSKRNSMLLNGLVLLLAIHTVIHILVIIASLPQLCDSSNFNWKEGYYFNQIHCHWKYELYYSFPFWFIDAIVPGIVAICLLYNK